MAVSKTLTSKLLNPTTTRTLILHLFTTDSPFSRLTSPHSRLFSPLPSPRSSLFLSSPPWMLSQSATPLWSRGEELHLNLKFKLNRKAVVGVGDGRVVRGGNEGGFVRENVWNLPNFISISRMVSGPVIGWMIINEWYFSSFMSLGISGMTDWLDGYAARKMNINSVLGSYLDPLADKVLIVCVALAMVKKDLLHPWLVVLVVLRDIGLVGGAVYKRASSLGWKWKSWSDFVSLNTTCPEKVKPLFISKVNTVLQLILVAGALLQPEFGTEDTQLYITYLSWIVGSTTVASSAAYGIQHVRRKAVAASVQ